MANICDNEMYFYCENENILSIIEDRLTAEECTIDADIYCVDTNFIEAFFESNWNFPKNYFDIIFKDINKGYFRCISKELGVGFIEINVWKDGEWIQNDCIEIKN